MTDLTSAAAPDPGRSTVRAGAQWTASGDYADI